MRIFSYGGGVQSTACLVLAAQGKIDYQTFIFSNVGDDSENPETLKYLKEHAMPFAKAHGLQLTETAWIGERGEKRGKQRTLYSDVMSAERTIDIPVRLQSGAFGNRKCTARYKIEPIEKWTIALGATTQNKATLGLGISFDESQRVGDSKTEHHINDYPLIGASRELSLTRQQCEEVIRDAGLPVPPKSSCFFCPFKNAEDWRNQRNNQPELHEKAILLEDHVNEIRFNLGRDEVFIGPGVRLRDLDKADDTESDGCETGYCHT